MESKFQISLASFQEAVSRFVRAAVIGGPYVATDTGGTTGSKRGCKVGDLVVRFTSESAFCGSAVVVEAKRDGSYTLARSLAEMELARANREAEAGVFVLSASHAPASFPRFSRYGKDLLVIWDSEDSRTDCYLHAALLAALCLASRKRVSTDECNVRALEDVAGRVESEISRLGKMRSHNETIRRNADSIAEEIRKGEDKLVLLLSKASEVMKALNVELHDVEAERKSPISLPAGSLERASALVGSGLSPQHF